jgi:hypothetical protein
MLGWKRVPYGRLGGRKVVVGKMKKISNSTRQHKQHKINMHVINLVGSALRGNTVTTVISILGLSTFSTSHTPSPFTSDIPHTHFNGHPEVILIL